MSDTNYFSGIVKILEVPKKKILKNAPFTKIRVQLPQMRGNKIISLTFWGNLAHDIENYYTIQDYIIIEGYVSLRNTSKTNMSNQVIKKPEITVLRIYPFLLNSSNSNIIT